MLEHLLVFLVCAPLQVCIGIWNTRSKWLTPGEVRFWGVAVFVFVEFCYLGAF